MQKTHFAPGTSISLKISWLVTIIRMEAAGCVFSSNTFLFINVEGKTIVRFLKEINYEKKVQRVMVINSTNINKTNNHLSP